MTRKDVRHVIKCFFAHVTMVGAKIKATKTKDNNDIKVFE
jgi:hypothetical protein